MKAGEEAERRFATDMNCAQSVLTTFCSDLGLDERTALKLAAPFGGGMGRRCQTCGAVTGGLMVLGLRFADPDPSNKEAKKKLLTISQKFLDKFKEREGALGCRDLLGIDIGTDEGQREAKEDDLFHKRCPRFVRTSAEKIEEIINEAGGP
jgi:C_GCAxxG_C_C family probable redox protein